jgi:YVTN family beta-propeller protein
LSTRLCFRLPAGRVLARCTLAALLTSAVLTVGAATQARAATGAGDIYVVNSGDNTVSVVDPETDTVVTTANVESFPTDVAVSPDGSQAWVVNNGDSAVSTIPTATNSADGGFAIFAGIPESIAFSPDGTRAYLGLTGGGIDVFDLSTGVFTADVPVGFRPVAIAVSPDGSRVYSANYGNGSDGSVSVIDAATDTVISTISDQHLVTPQSITLSPDGSLAYVADPGSGVVYVINTATNRADRMQGGDDPVDVSLSPDGAYAYVADGNANAVTVVNTATDAVIATIPVGESPQAVLVSRDGTTAYTANRGSNDVSVIDTATNTVTATIPVGSGPVALAQSPTAPPPFADLVSPNSGALSGGTTVTITGWGFTGATAVSFGGIPATSFTVNSDTTITATAPPAAGIGTVAITVTTPAGTSQPERFTNYTYLYAFSGFLAPVANPPAANAENAGKAIPIQFNLGGNEGLGILASGYPAVQQVDCRSDRPDGQGSPAATAGNSGLQYDAGTGTYTFVWKTAKAYAGTCQVFELGLNDGTVYYAMFAFS